MNTQLAPSIIILIILAYFGGLVIISFFTGKNASNQSFFNANKSSPWFVVAFGMIGATLSGVTFISIPGVVGKGGINMAFSYMQVVMGYLVGYFLIATVLMPIYYKLSLTSIYGYLQGRFGKTSHKTGSGFFLLSRIIGASLRLYLVALVFDTFIFSHWGVPYWATVLITILLIWSYTFKAGIKTIVWTDTLQTTFILIAVIATIFTICNAMDTNLSGMWGMMQERAFTKTFFFEEGWSDPNNFFKQFVTGALMAFVMTGLDQDMMQKNLTCKTLKEAQKNMFTFSIILFFANILFLSLGAMLFIYADFINMPIPDRTDTLYPSIAFNHLPVGISVVFILGLIAAAYSSADSALTSLTTAFCVDFLDFENSDASEKEKRKQRFGVHIAFSVVLFIVIILFKAWNNDAAINALFILSGYTYGPILGLFTFGILTKRKVRDKLVLPVAILAPCLAYMLNKYSAQLFSGLSFGFLILAVNGLLTFVGLWLISTSNEK